MIIESLLSYGLVLTILPACLVILLADRLVTAQAGMLFSSRRGSKFLLVSAVVLLLPFAIFSAHLFTDWIGLLALLLIPALVGVFSLIFIHWRGVAALLETDRALTIALGVLLVLLVTLSGMGQPTFPLAVLVGSLLIAAIWVAIRHLHGGTLIAAGIICILFLLADATGLGSSPDVFDVPALHLAYNLGGELVSILALGAAALLIHAALNEPNEPGRKAGLRRIIYLSLAGLVLLSLCAAMFRNAVMVKATGRALEDHLPFLTVMLAVIVGVFLALMGGKGSRVAGIGFLVCVPLALLSAYLLGWQVDPDAVTASRAGRIAQAIRAYHREKGAYPESLEQLTPDYLPVLLGPLNGRGQRWCYQGVGDTYRLGYVNFKRYGQPDLSYRIEILARDGKIPPGPWMCIDELNRMKELGGL